MSMTRDSGRSAASGFGFAGLRFVSAPRAFSSATPAFVSAPLCFGSSMVLLPSASLCSGSAVSASLRSAALPLRLRRASLVFAGLAASGLGWKREKRKRKR